MSAANGTNNEGHGHVYPRPDGVRMRCGGPNFCRDCSVDFARKQLEGTREAMKTHFADDETLAHIAKLEEIEAAAYGMTLGLDWNNGTHAKHHRVALCKLVAAYRRDFPKE